MRQRMAGIGSRPVSVYVLLRRRFSFSGNNPLLLLAMKNTFLWGCFATAPVLNWKCFQTLKFETSEEEEDIGVQSLLCQNKPAEQGKPFLNLN
jgi:hypothetical protein